MTLFTFRPTKPAAFFLLLMIAFAIVLALFPSLRQVQGVKTAFEVTMLPYFFFWIQRVRSQSDLKRPIFSPKDKDHPNFELPALEMAALISWFITDFTAW